MALFKYKGNITGLVYIFNIIRNPTGSNLNIWAQNNCTSPALSAVRALLAVGLGDDLGLHLGVLLALEVVEDLVRRGQHHLGEECV